MASTSRLPTTAAIDGDRESFGAGCVTSMPRKSVGSSGLENLGQLKKKPKRIKKNSQGVRGGDLLVDAAHLRVDLQGDVVRRRARLRLRIRHFLPIRDQHNLTGHAHVDVAGGFDVS